MLSQMRVSSFDTSIRVRTATFVGSVAGGIAGGIILAGLGGALFYHYKLRLQVKAKRRMKQEEDDDEKKKRHDESMPIHLGL
jgi:hypothetical protein